MRADAIDHARGTVAALLHFRNGDRWSSLKNGPPPVHERHYAKRAVAKFFIFLQTSRATTCFMLSDLI
jgi:hypothetical protein